MSVDPIVIQKLNVFALARTADRAARIGSHVVGRGVAYGALRGAARGAAAGAYRGFLETRRVRRAMRVGRNFRNGFRAGYSNGRFLASGGNTQERNARLLRMALARRTRAGAVGHEIGRRAFNAQTNIGRSARVLVSSFARQGKRVASYWRNR